jgi:hypothetical protein
VERELLTYPEYMSLLPVFSGVRVTQSVVLLCSVLFCRSLLSSSRSTNGALRATLDRNSARVLINSICNFICMFVDRCLSFSLFLLVIVLSVLLRFTDSDYLFGISSNCTSSNGWIFIFYFFPLIYDWIRQLFSSVTWDIYRS